MVNPDATTSAGALLAALVPFHPESDHPGKFRRAEISNTDVSHLNMAE